MGKRTPCTPFPGRKRSTRTAHRSAPLAPEPGGEPKPDSLHRFQQAGCIQSRSRYRPFQSERVARVIQKHRPFLLLGIGVQ